MKRRLSTITFSFFTATLLVAALIFAPARPAMAHNGAGGELHGSIIAVENINPIDEVNGIRAHIYVAGHSLNKLSHKTIDTFHLSNSHRIIEQSRIGNELTGINHSAIAGDGIAVASILHARGGPNIRIAHIDSAINQEIAVIQIRDSHTSIHRLINEASGIEDRIIARSNSISHSIGAGGISVIGPIEIAAAHGPQAAFHNEHIARNHSARDGISGATNSNGEEIDWDSQAQKDMRVRIACSKQSCEPIGDSFGRNANWLPGWELRWWAFRQNDERSVWVYHARSKTSGERYTSFVDPRTGQLQSWESAR